MNGSLKKYIFNIALIAALTGFALWFALKDDYDTVMNLISNLKWYQFLVILFWGLFYYVLIGWILATITKKFNKNYSIKDGFINGIVGGFFSGITPSATGGQIGQAYIFKRQGIKYSDGASILWIDFIIYQTVMMCYVAILFLLKFSHYYNMSSGFFSLVLVGFFVNGCVIAALWTMAKFPKLYVKLSRWAVKLLDKIKLIKNPEKTIDSFTMQLNAFTSQINNLKDDKLMIFKAVVINIIRVTVLFSLPYYIFYIAGANINISMLIEVIAMSSFVSMVNAFFPVPGATGATESVFILIFSNVFRRDLCATVMILWRFATYHLIIIVGAIVFAIYKNMDDCKKSKIELKEELCE